MILTDPVVKFIDYGNAVFEGQKKPATKFHQKGLGFRAWGLRRGPKPP